MTLTVAREEIGELSALGVVAFTTTRAAGTFGTQGTEAVGETMGRWWRLVDELRTLAPRFATARQVHGSRVVEHGDGWEGWLRVGAADGHVAGRGTALAVTIADCVPVFVAHPSGAVALLHSGWRGTAARILEQGIAALARRGLAPRDLGVHLGPAICGACYEVSPEVYGQLTGCSVDVPTTVDLRAVIAGQARAAGVTRISVSAWCTRCHNDRFFSHRAGDAGRQLGVIAAPF
ncbi:MAG TPA: polyphenol oxidase family protein [Gemmatimonadaceae bacterium]|nr:polyphenol oxidase family protein [Gemmatimonadaceae bacterium]